MDRDTNVAALGKSYFGHPVSDAEYAALAAAGLVQPLGDQPANQVVPKPNVQTVEKSRPVSVSVDGMPAQFAAGAPVDYRRPPVNPALNDEAALEGQRFAGRVAGEQPYRSESDALIPGVGIPGAESSIRAGHSIMPGSWPIAEWRSGTRTRWRITPPGSLLKSSTMTADLAISRAACQRPRCRLPSRTRADATCETRLAR